MKIIEINLDLPAHQRWDFAVDYQKEINEIIACYWVDIEDYLDLILGYLDEYKQQFVPKAYWEEIQCIAKYCDFSPDQVLIANLYYDIVKFAFACTAFAFEKDQTIWHARNLDWWTENDILKKYTNVFKFTRNGQTVFQSVGWVGFIGVLSGFKPNGFSVTLNAIVSDEAPNIATPITFLLREVLEGDNDFASAKNVLENTDIVCDCLLLVAGLNSSEMIVIERTPRTSKTRSSTNGYIIVTNDYQLMDYETRTDNALSSSSCGRYDQTKKYLEHSCPSNLTECFQVLDDPKVKMQITVQQMVFNAKQNLLNIKIE